MLWGSWLYIASILFLVFFQHGHRLLGMLSKKQRYLLFYRLQSSICTFNYKYESYLLFFFLFPIATNPSPVDHLLLDLFMVVFLVDLNPIYHFPYGLLRRQCARMRYQVLQSSSDFLFCYGGDTHSFSPLVIISISFMIFFRYSSLSLW